MCAQGYITYVERKYIGQYETPNTCVRHNSGLSFVPYCDFDAKKKNLAFCLTSHHVKM